MNDYEFEHFFDSTPLGDAYTRLHETDIMAQRMFCASCCERLVATYQMYHDLSGYGKPRTLRGAINALWSHKVQTLTEEAVQILQNEISIHDDDETLWSRLAIYTSEAVKAGLWLLHPDYQKSSSRVEVIVGVDALEAVHDYVWWTALPDIQMTRNSLPTSTDGSTPTLHCVFGDGLVVYTHMPNGDVDDIHHWITASPLLQAEVSYQLHDVEILLDKGATVELAAQLKKQSRIAGIQPYRRRLIMPPESDESDHVAVPF